MNRTLFPTRRKIEYCSDTGLIHDNSFSVCLKVIARVAHHIFHHFFHHAKHIHETTTLQTLRKPTVIQLRHKAYIVNSVPLVSFVESTEHQGKFNVIGEGSVYTSVSVAYRVFIHPDFKLQNGACYRILESSVFFLILFVVCS